MTEPVRFALGQIVLTPGVRALPLSYFVLSDLLQRHVRGDYGALCDQDKAVNEAAIAQSLGRVFSCYEVGGTLIWIITDAVGLPMAVTTLLLPSEY